MATVRTEDIDERNRLVGLILAGVILFLVVIAIVGVLTLN
jgi:hypothetical protein